jgi:hypothetical protein
VSGIFGVEFPKNAAPSGVFSFYYFGPHDGMSRHSKNPYSHLNSSFGPFAIFVPALLAGRITFAPLRMALFDQFNSVLDDVPGFLGLMRPEKRFRNLVLAQAADHFF